MAEPTPRPVFAALRRAVVRGLKALVVLLLVVIPVPVASLFARGEKGEKRNLPGQVVRKEDEDGG